MKTRIFLLILIAFTPVVVTAQRQASIVGSWKLISYEDKIDAGGTDFPWGKHPSGVLIYDDTGHMAVQIQGTPVDKSITKTESKLSTAEKVKQLGAYTAYFGTYTVNWELMTITHHVTGNLFPVYIGTDQEKGFELDGDRLTLKAAWNSDGKQWTGTRVFERIKPQTAH